MKTEDSLKVYVDEDWIIRQKFYNNLSSETIEKAEKLSVIFKRKLKALDKPVLFCVDLRRVKKHSFASRRASYRSLRTKRFDKIAIITDDNIMKKIAETIITIADKREKVRFFKSEESATDWLLGKLS